MKATMYILNGLIAVCLLTIISDVEINSQRTELDYSKSLLGIAGLVIFGFLRIYHREFFNHITKKQ